MHIQNYIMTDVTVNVLYSLGLHPLAFHQDGTEACYCWLISLKLDLLIFPVTVSKCQFISDCSYALFLTFFFLPLEFYDELSFILLSQAQKEAQATCCSNLLFQMDSK